MTEGQREKYLETKYDIWVLIGESKRSAVEREEKELNYDKVKVVEELVFYLGLRGWVECQQLGREKGVQSKGTGKKEGPAHIHALVNVPRVYSSQCWGAVEDETRWMKIVEGLNGHTQEFDLYSLGSRKPLKVLLQDSDIQLYFRKTSPVAM